MLWIEQGWIDYVAPQLYWEIGHKRADYKTLADWWAEAVVPYSCALYIGVAAWRMSPEMLQREVLLNDTTSAIDGTIFYSAKPYLIKHAH